jgi:PAS domain S-box-containing protein
MKTDEHSDQLLSVLETGIEDHAFFLLDAKGFITSWTPVDEQIKGYSKEEILGKHFSCLYPEEKVDPDEPAKNLEQAVSTGTSTTEGWRKKKDGSLFWAKLLIKALRDDHDNLTGFVKITQDLTERKRIEEHRSHLSAIVALSHDAIITTKTDGIIVSWNRGAQNLYGYSGGEIIGKSIQLVFAPKFFMPALQDLAESLNFETTHITKAGVALTTSVTLSPMKDPDGNVTEVSWICRDVTDNSKILDELKRSNRDLQQFAYVASHDLQEPVRAVIGCLQLLDESLGEKLSERSQKFLTEAKNGATRMQVLVRDLLSYARVHIRAAELLPTELSQIFSQAIDNLRVSIDEYGAKITCEELPIVEADPSQIGQVFQNFLGNAIKYRSQAPPEIHVGVTRRFNEWVFCITDNGIGFDIKFADRIFDIFQRLHPRSKYAGTGIGLAVCKSIVERHGGRVWVESERGKGSKFYFTLPVKLQGDGQWQDQLKC